MHDSLEQIWVKLNMPGLSISVGVLYLPPDRKADLTSINNHIDSVQSVFPTYDQTILLISSVTTTNQIYAGTQRLGQVQP